jgi:hypothetical protein
VASIKIELNCGAFVPGLTGISHEKLNLFHRGVARCILVLIWIHFWGRFVMRFYYISPRIDIVPLGSLLGMCSFIRVKTWPEFAVCRQGSLV